MGKLAKIYYISSVRPTQPGQPMLRDRKRSSKIVELVDCLTDDADNMLRLVREAPACGSYTKNVQHKEQITLDNLLYKLSKGRSCRIML